MQQSQSADSQNKTSDWLKQHADMQAHSGYAMTYEPSGNTPYAGYDTINPPYGMNTSPADYYNTYYNTGYE